MVDVLFIVIGKFANNPVPQAWSPTTRHPYNANAGTADAVLSEQFKLHLHRGISYLAGDKKNKTINGLLGGFRSTLRIDSPDHNQNS